MRSSSCTPSSPLPPIPEKTAPEEVGPGHTNDGTLVREPRLRGGRGPRKVIWKTSIIATALFAIVCTALFAPIVKNLFFLPTHYEEHRSPHPPSPITPATADLSRQDVESFRRDGVMVLRGILSDALKEKLQIAGDDMMAQPIRHCEMTKFTGPPIFHGYERYCGRAQLIHDYLRDVAFTSPLTHVAAQLMGAAGSWMSAEEEEEEEEEELKATKGPIRQFADIFMAGAQLPRRWHTDYLAFQNYMADKSTVGCGDGLVFWIPLEKSYEAKSGMIFINGTSSRMEERFRDRPEAARDPAEYQSWMKSVSKEEYFAPTLELGDVIVFDQCTVHAASGINTKNEARRAYQLRFIRNAVEEFLLDDATVIIPGPPQHDFAGANMPQMWPATLPEEDAIRAKGPMVFSRWQWAKRLTLNPAFTLHTTKTSLQTRLFGDAGELGHQSKSGIPSPQVRRQPEQLVHASPAAHPTSITAILTTTPSTAKVATESPVASPASQVEATVETASHPPLISSCMDVDWRHGDLGNGCGIAG